MEVGKVRCVSLCTGCVAELNVCELLSSLYHEILMTEAVSEDDAASAVNKLGSCIVASALLRNVLLCDHLDTKLLTCFFSTDKEVVVIG